MYVYLYVIRANRFYKKYGKLIDFPPNINPRYPERYYTFHEVNEERVELRKPNKVAVLEGEIRNGTIWYREENDVLAKSKLIAYEKMRIAGLNKKIRQLEQDIETIKKGL